MRSVLQLVLLAPWLAASAASGMEKIRATIDVSDLRVVVTYVSPSELVALQRKHDEGLDLRNLRRAHHRGLSILARSRDTGVLTCWIYLPEEQRPREVDDDATRSLGHELLHCLAGDYHR